MGGMKDNWKVLAAILGVVVMVWIMSLTVTNPGGYDSFGGSVFEVYDAVNEVNVGVGDTGGSEEVNESETQAEPKVTTTVAASAISNGKNGFYSSAPVMNLKNNTDYSAVINTNEGSITVDLYETQIPLNVNNFIFLANNNFYDGTSFHRVVPGQFIQGGDPLGTGNGGPGYGIQDEFVPSIKFKGYVVAMANGENNNGSQFFITSRKFDQFELNNQFTIIGEVTDGFQVVDKIESVELSSDQTTLGRPISPVTINRVSIVQ